jgi:hypothetical protein
LDGSFFDYQIELEGSNILQPAAPLNFASLSKANTPVSLMTQHGFAYGDQARG